LDSKKATTDKGYIKFYSIDLAIVALKDEDSITSWGDLGDSWDDSGNLWGVWDDLDHKHKTDPFK
jgi:hypothetical protein